MRKIKQCLCGGLAAALAIAGCGRSGDSRPIEISFPEVKVRPIRVDLSEALSVLACRKSESEQGPAVGDVVVARQVEAVESRQMVRRFACDGSVTSFKRETIGFSRFLVRLSGEETGARGAKAARVRNQRSCKEALGRLGDAKSAITDPGAALPERPIFDADGRIEFVVGVGAGIQLGGEIPAWPGINNLEIAFSDGCNRAQECRVRTVGLRLQIIQRIVDLEGVLDVPANDCASPALNRNDGPLEAGRGERHDVR